MQAIPIHIGRFDLILLILQGLIYAMTAFTGLYSVLVFLRSPLRKPKPLTEERPVKKILALVPARNEQQGLPKLLQSLAGVDYPKALLHVIVLADNCQDKTADIARAAGVKVLERHDLSRQTKADALRWAFLDQDLLNQGYDAITILDADSTVDPAFFRHTERKLREGAQVVQGQRMASNTAATAITSMVSIQYSFESRFWLLPHANTDRSVNMFGTGVTITCQHLQAIGWNISTLVEDSEFGIQTMLAGVQVHYCDEAQTSLELPRTVKALWRQMRRWFSGNLDCARLYLPAVAKKVAKDRGGHATILLVLLLLPFNCIFGLIQCVLGPLVAYSLFGSRHSLEIILLGFVFNQILGMAGAVLILLFDGRLPSQNSSEHWKYLWKGIVLFPFSYIFYSVIFLYSFIFPKKSWELSRANMKARQMHKELTDTISMK
jgi:cellulose synthase/poly-beta-1,6-N-acetylglucosamine synthase-like glycosyltransferase